MKKFLLKSLGVLYMALITLSLSAQQPSKSQKKRLTHHMSPQEQLLRGEIGRNFVETDPPAGNVISLGEFERAKGVVVAYPFGIPMTLIREMARDAIVTTLVTGLSQENSVRNQYTAAGVNIDNCNFIYAPTDSYWTRDYGPWFISYNDDQIGIVDFPYNRPRPNDDEAPKIIASALGLEWFGMNVKQTGGNYMSDSYGNASSTTIAYTENPTLTPAQVDQKMLDYLGINNYHVIEDPNNTYIDHIDCWGKYLATNKVLIRSVPTSHPQYDEIEATAAYFASLTSPWGVPYQVFRVNTPQNQPYTNSFILNNKVFVPIMNSQYDAAALEVYRQAMPGYTIISVIALPGEPWESTDALHCRTHEMADPGMLRIRHIPLLGNVPANPTFTFPANITSYGGSEVIADSALLYYRINPNPYTPYAAIPLSNTMGNNWSVQIPSPAYGSTVQYYLHAADASGRSENHPFIGKADAHEFFVGEQLLAQAETDQQAMQFTAMKDTWSAQTLSISNTGELGLDYFITLSTDLPDTLTKTLTNSPAPNAYDFNTFTESGWTSLNITEAGTLKRILISYTWTTDSYATEGSFWAESPGGLKFKLAEGQNSGVYTLTEDRFEGQQLQGSWKFWIEDSNGDGGHQAKNITVRFIRITPTGDWLTADLTQGSIAAGDFQEIVLTCDATDMGLGTYTGKIHLLSNDPDDAEIDIPVTFTVTVNTAVQQPALADEIRVYPNPADDLLNIETGALLQGPVLLMLTDATGATLISKEVQATGEQNTFQLNTSGLNSGIYFLVIQSSKERSVVKVVIQEKM